MRLRIAFIGLILQLLPALLQAHPGVDAAIAHFDALIEASPREQLLWIQRGIVYSNDGQFEKALSDFTRAQALGDPVLVSYELGVLHYRKGDFPTSRRYFDTFLERFPDNAQCLEYRARMRRDAGDTDGAIADFGRALALQKQPNPGDYLSLAELLQSRGETGIARAIGVLDEAMAKIGLTPPLQRKAIELELLRGQTDRAIERLRTLESMLGDSGEWKVQMGELLLKAGRDEEARQQFRAAVAQLRGLRPTPARLELLKRARAQLDGAPGEN